MAEKIISIENLVKQACDIFEHEFKIKPNTAVFAPGRVNIIGEHTDYNDGFVLPMALPMGTVIVGTKIDGDKCKIVTKNKDVDDPKVVEFVLPQKSEVAADFRPGKPKWANYIKGVVANYVGEIPGFLAVVISSVPIGGGLSSSAALEVASYTFLDALTSNNSTTLTDKALACQKAEHDFAGMPCGIMDQFISVMGKKDHALLIDCRNLTSKLIPFIEEDVMVLITNSNVKHELTGSEYPARRQQCHQAAVLLKKSSLRDANLKDIALLKNLDIEPEIVKRGRHVVTEIQRTEMAAEALNSRDMKKLGLLMSESHLSLKIDFEVSCQELDELVELALQVDGVLGSRMTGGGFGGCTVTLVHKDSVDKVIKNIENNYSKKATFYVCKPSEGAQTLKL